MRFSEHVRDVLLGLISKMSDCSWMFASNPGVDFTRKRKLDFETMLKLLISIESGSLNNELLKYFHFSGDSATVSAFNQQRKKILPEALEFLFYKFNEAFSEKTLYRGYRLLACDGSDLNIARNPDDTDNYFQSSPEQRGFNQLHLNALYDLGSRRYVDAVIQPGRKNNESRAMTDMIDRYHSDVKTIFIADRGYESYNIFAHAQRKNMYYLIRVKDGGGGSIVSSLNLPETDEFDVTLNLILTKKQTNEVKAHPEIYKIIYPSNVFDYLDLHVNKYCPMTFRVVRFPITEETYECIITNLSGDEFPPEEIKRIYGMRWGIETSFRELKYAVGMVNFHAKKVEYIKQEIFARLILYNFCEIIAAHVIVEKKHTKHTYQLNYTIAIHICQYFLQYQSDISPPDVEALICRYLLPVRPGRHVPRNVKSQSVVSFLYRVA